MTYVQNGQVVDRRGYGLNTLLDFFWSIVDAIGFFLQTLVNPSGSASYKQYGRSKKWDDKRGPGSGPSSGGGSGGPRITGMDRYRGSGSMSTCRSCCGGGGCG